MNGLQRLLSGARTIENAHAFLMVRAIALKAQLLAPGLARPPRDLYFLTAFKSQLESLTKPWRNRIHET